MNHILFDADSMLGRHPRMNVGDGSIEQLLSRMDNAGIAEAIVGHTYSWLHDPQAGNNRVVELVADQPRLRPVWVMLPDTCGELGTPKAFVASAQEHGVCAIRAYPLDHGFTLAGLDAAPMLDAIAGAGLPLLLDGIEISWPDVEAIALTHPELSIVVGQCGYRVTRRIAGVLERTQNVYIGLSNMSLHCGLEWLVERFSARRLVFGTGMPCRDPGEAVTRLMWSDLDDGAVAAIGAANLRRLIGSEVGA